MTQEDKSSEGSKALRAWTILLTFIGLGIVLGVGLWDVNHEDTAALQRLIRENHRLAVLISQHASPIAQEASANSASWVDANGVALGPRPIGPNAAKAAYHERLVVLLADAARRQYRSPTGQPFDLPELSAAEMRGEPGAVLSREVAAQLGLPRRTAVAGVAQLPETMGHFRAVAVVASAEAERDRSHRERWRSAIEVGLASLLVLLAGVGALRMQKRDLELAQQRSLHQIERARDAELARANRMATIAALSSGIAHQLSTPLGVITGRIEQLLAAASGQPRLERPLHTIAEQVSRIEKIMRGFLAFAKGDTPMLVHKSATSLAREVVRLVEYRFLVAQVALELTTKVDDSIRVACDPALFAQALIDILVNALEASKPNQRVGFVVDADESKVSFTVSDEGAGISSSVIARVTDPFVTTKSSKGGSGLGLAISKEIVVHHRGVLSFDLRQEVESPDQPGTRVTVLLPLVKEVLVESRA
jgi:signal transduction histidine kinase